VRRIVRDNFVELSENVRCSVDLSLTLCDAVARGVFEVPPGVASGPADLSLRRHLTYTNACSAALNDAVLRREVRRHRSVLWWDGGRWGTATGVRSMPRGVRRAVTRQTPLLVLHACRYGRKNCIVTVDSYRDDTVRLDGSPHPIVPDFFALTAPAYSITVHKAQGMTIEQPYQIHEIRKMKHLKEGASLLYVALTRASHAHYAMMCDGCACDVESSRNLCGRWA
jgi:hypothetical protein